MNSASPRLPISLIPSLLGFPMCKGASNKIFLSSSSLKNPISNLIILSLFISKPIIPNETVNEY